MGDIVDGTSDRNGTSFTNKEMWVRVDGKLDAISAKLGHYDVEIALIKERVTQVENARNASVEASNANKAALEKQLEDLAAGQFNLGRAAKFATATVVAVVVAVDAVARFFG